MNKLRLFIIFLIIFYKSLNTFAYDYIVVGAGSAGSIVATRLAKNGSSVLILDGGDGSVYGLGGADVAGTQGIFDSKNEYTAQKTFTKYDIPLYWSSVYITGKNWDIVGASVAKVTGGCAMHNGMVFQRGKSSNYDGWNVSGWSWTDLFKYFLRIETILDPELSTSTNHGHSGPIKVKSIPFDQEGNDFITACQSAGLPFNSDFNQNEYRDGCGYFQFNIDENGIRSSPFHKYLMPALSMPNLRLVTQVTVLKINFLPATTSGGQPIARSVLVQFNTNSSTAIFTANKEIIISAGALNTPKILLNSGIGNSTYLASYSSKIPNVYSNLPGVGRNLQNHFLSFTVWSYNAPFSRPTFYDLFTQNFAFEAGGGGILGTPGFSVGAWLRPNATAVGEAENVMLILPGTLGTTTPFPALSIGISISQPQPNNHWIELNTNTSGTNNEFYAKSPNLQFTLLNKNEDVMTLVRGIKESRRIMSYPPMNERASPVSPPPTISSDNDLADWVRTNTIAHDHWCGTAKMGSTSDPMAVVDQRLRVIGVKNLRVIDASVIPTIVNSLLHATVMVIAEKGSDMVLDDNFTPSSTTGGSTTGGSSSTTTGGLLTLTSVSLPTTIQLTSL